jgi:hypothetical protein
MGWVEVRHSDDGDPRYRAKYRDARGRKQTAGTFDDEAKAQKEADLAGLSGCMPITMEPRWLQLSIRVPGRSP